MSEVEWLDRFARNLKEMLGDYNMTQGELAEMSGLSEPTISSYVNQTRMPGVKALLNISYAFGITVDELIDFGDKII